MAERFLVTGAFGCIGAWVVRELTEAGVPVVGFDLGDDPRRLRLIMPADAVARLPMVRGDISDLPALERALDEHAITSVIHLAALQIPFCRADPARGAAVNVVGTANVFEAVRRRGERLRHVVYASSIAAFDAPGQGIAGAGMAGLPSTLYGVYKRANEGTAHVFWQDTGVSSIGLRPHTVYGPGRDQGLTSAPTVAMLAAAAGVPYGIPFGGRCQLQHTRDIARAFIAAARVEHAGAAVLNPPGRVVAVSEIVAAIERAVPEARGAITAGSEPLALPAEASADAFTAIVGELPQLTLDEGVAATVAAFRDLLARGLVAPPTLEAGS